MCYSKVCIALLVLLNMHIGIKPLTCIVKIVGNFMCHLPLTKGEVGASTVERSSFLSAKSKHQTIYNKHAFKQVFKKAWYAWYATQFRA